MAAKKLAVVVVHGVADQKPAESARQIANLLTDLRPRGTYSTFQEEQIRVPVEPVTKSHEEEVRRSPFEERNRDAILRHRGHPPPIAPEHGFMFDQLRCYDELEHPRVFETVRLDGKHNAAGCTVHVYEAYWADLSRLGTGIVTFFGELYQLLLHLPSLGRNAVDYARAEDSGKLWPLFSWWHRWSVRWLTLFIAVLNLVLASLILPALAPRLTRTVTPQRSEEQIACNIFPSPPPPGRFNAVDLLVRAVPAVAFIAAAAFLLRRRRPPAFVWAVIPLVAAAAGALIGHLAAVWCGGGRVLVVEAWLLSAVGVGALLVQYESMRHGAKWLGIVGLSGALLTLVYFLRQGNGGEEALTHAVLHTLQVVNAALQVVWRIHVTWLLITIVLGFLCWAAASKPWKQRAWNTIWTARTTLTLSTALFANLTLALWAALFTAVQKILPNGCNFRPLPIPTLLAPGGDSGVTTPAGFLQRTLMLSASRGFILITVVFGIFAIAAIWAIFPSVLVETNPLKKQESETTRMRVLGVWLTRGLNFIPAVAEIFALLLVVIAVTFIRTWLHPAPPAENSWTAISAAAALLIALIGARFWLPGASGALDVILDVDNYLRQHPKDDAPRARIAERCASLLRFILDRERNGGHNYDGLVIVAHSQGTIITSDLLRYLKVGDQKLSDDLAAMKPAYFTMGCPLRQLYARAFPALYPWIPGSATPAELGIARWVNAYGSGDYVGRIIWGDPAAIANWDRRLDHDGNPNPTPIANGIEQMCVGEAAHTHYWDRFGHDVAWMLDRLIVTHCGEDA